MRYITKLLDPQGDQAQVCENGEKTDIWNYMEWDGGELDCIPNPLFSKYPDYTDVWYQQCGYNSFNTVYRIRLDETLSLPIDAISLPRVDDRCNLHIDWYYTPSMRGEGHYYCNDRDLVLGRRKEVCLPPDTDPSILKPWQYRGANEIFDRTNDPEVQKPYFWNDLAVQGAFCERYPLFQICEDFKTLWGVNQ